MNGWSDLPRFSWDPKAHTPVTTPCRFLSGDIFMSQVESGYWFPYLGRTEAAKIPGPPARSPVFSFQTPGVIFRLSWQVDPWGPGTGQLTEFRLLARVDDPEHVICGLLIFLV